MSDSNPQSKSNLVAWLAIGCGVLCVGALGLVFFGSLFWGVRSPPTSPAPSAPTPAPAAPTGGEQR